jgi:hypothetical protein
MKSNKKKGSENFPFFVPLKCQKLFFQFNPDIQFF